MNKREMGRPTLDPEARGKKVSVWIPNTQLETIEDYARIFYSAQLGRAVRGVMESPRLWVRYVSEDARRTYAMGWKTKRHDR